jgi:serine kinase of HPr protein (carbohydrate metabolism regulator)
VHSSSCRRRCSINAYLTRYELIEFAVFTLAQRVQGLVPLHAACVGRAGRGLLLMGGSGAGKSTLALHCLARRL